MAVRADRHGLDYAVVGEGIDHTCCCLRISAELPFKVAVSRKRCKSFPHIHID